MNQPDTIIVGGGLIGLLTARELRMAGRDVLLLERGEPGRESSWAGGGILSPLYPWRYPDAVTALAGWSQPRYEAFCDELRTESGVDPEWTRSGLLILSPDEIAQAVAWAEANGPRLEAVGAEAVEDIEPALGEKTEPAVWMPEVAQVRNPRLLQAARGALTWHGGAIRSGMEVTGILSEGGRVTGVETREGTIYADSVVVAGGAWSGGILAGTGLDLPIRPVLGQMLLFHAAPELVKRIVLSRDRYVIPRRDGRVLVGSTVEETGFDKQITDQARQELYAEALRLIPALAEAPVERQWAGLRPGSPDGVPFIGPHPELEGLWVNAGHFRNGVVLGLASVRLLGDLMTGRTPILDPKPYAPGV